MGTIVRKNKTTFIRCPKNKEHPFSRISSKIYSLDGYMSAIMGYILSNKDNWKIVKSEIAKRAGFPRDKFNKAWKSLEERGYIIKTQIQGGWSYIIVEDPDFTPTVFSNCEESTLTKGRQCKGGILTTIKENYNYYNNISSTDANCHDEQFNELCELYPKSSKWNDGRTVPLKKNLAVCKKLYNDLLTSGDVSHDEIMSCLRNELKDREQSSTQQYQPALLKWLKEKGWELYKDRTLKPVSSGYGTEIE